MKKKGFKFDLVQPNKVTEARYDYNATQENILTCVIDAIQDQITQSKPIQTDLFSNPYITILASDVAMGKNKYYVWEEVKKMRKKDIDFEWINPDTNKNEEVNTSLFSEVRNETDTDKIHLGISKWAVPYLVYWGKGVGGTIYNKKTALLLTGSYTKRIYKLCCQWKDRGGFTMDLDKFKEILGIEGKYKPPKDLKRWVLEPAKIKMKEKSEIYFEYSLDKIESRSYNVIRFKILNNTLDEEQKNSNEWYSYCYAHFKNLYPTSDKGRVMLDLITEQGMLRTLYSRLTRLDDDLTSGKIQGRKHFENILKVFLKEDLNIQNV